MNIRVFPCSKIIALATLPWLLGGCAQGGVPAPPHRSTAAALAHSRAVPGLLRPVQGRTATPASGSMPAFVVGQPLNPAVRRFSRALCFYVSFNHRSDEATLSAGSGAPLKIVGAMVLRPGLYGQALRSGRMAVRYEARGNIDLSRGGALALWISAYHWNRLEKHVPYVFFLQVNDHGRNLLLGRMGVRQNNEALEMYMAAGKKHLCLVPGNTLGWTTGQWHLLVVDWTAGSVAVSLDGQVWNKISAAWLEQARGPAGSLQVGEPYNSVKQRFLLDELLVLNRPLTMNEVRWLYRRGRRQMRRTPAAAMDRPGPPRIPKPQP